MNVASLKKWNVLLPEFTKLGKNKLVKFYPPVLIGIEFVANRFGKGEYCPYLFIESFIATQFNPGICYLKELRKTPEKNFWYFPSMSQVEDDELNTIIYENNSDFSLLLNLNLKAYDLIRFLNEAINEDRIIFGNLSDTLKLLSYLYMQLPEPDISYRKDKYNYFRSMITNDERFKRLPEHFYKELLADMQMYYENPLMTKEVIERNIQQSKVAKLNVYNFS